MILLALIAALQATPNEADRPYSGKLTSTQPTTTLAACIAQQLDKAGDVKQSANGDQIGLFFTFKVLPMMPGNGGHMQVTVVPADAGSAATATYGHPISAKTVDRQFRIFAKKCGGVATPGT